MRTKHYAQPGCPRCKGHPGRVKIGPGITDWAVCPCAIFGQRIEGAELFIANHLPPRAQTMTFETFQTGGNELNERALRVALNFVDNYLRARENGWVLGLWGEPRTGKTHLAVAIAQACARRFSARPMLMNLPQALRAERERFGDKTKDSQLEAAAEAELLILDDLGAEYQRQGTGQVSWVTEQLYLLLDNRYMRRLPTVYTTNLRPSQLNKQLDNEAGRRILGRLREAERACIEVQAIPGLHDEHKRADIERLLASR